MYKLSVSNIGWEARYDNEMYGFMMDNGYKAIEIAPTRLFPERPYDKLSEAKQWANRIRGLYGLNVASMQSIWFGRQEKLFCGADERRRLIDYTKKAIDFANNIDCHNLVFGCPKNRCIHSGYSLSVAIDFFKEIGDYAYSNQTVIGMEANPSIYNTDYINDTISAIELIKQVDSKGFKLNLDLGTVIHNNEELSLLDGNSVLINHVHISEPYLAQIKERKIHEELRDYLIDENYQGYVSIEMGKVDDIYIIQERMHYVKEIFCDLRKTGGCTEV